jgi:hypothetical protein
MVLTGKLPSGGTFLCEMNSKFCLVDVGKRVLLDLKTTRTLPLRVGREKHPTGRLDVLRPGVGDVSAPPSGASPAMEDDLLGT